MDTDKCKALIKAVELGNLSAAAEELGYTPSGISRMMTSLESEIGFPLLMRSQRGVKATPECEKLMPHFRALVADSYRTMRHADSIRGIETGEVRVGTYYPAFYRPIARLIAEFSEKYPGIDVDFFEGMSSEMAVLVEERRADFCIISKREGDFEWMPLMDDPMVALVPADSRLASKSAVRAEDLRREPFIRVHPETVTDASIYLEKQGIVPDVRFRCSSMYAAYQMVGAGLGIALDNSIFSEQYLPLFEGSVRAVPLEDPYNVSIGIATPRKELQSPAARKFVEMSAKHFIDAR